jgi:hypothetical protein
MRRFGTLRRIGLLTAVLVAVAVACTAGEDPEPPSSPSALPSVEVKTGPTTALQAMRRLCVAADIVVNPVTEVPTPASIAEVQDQIEAVRGLSFERPVNVEPVTPAEIDRRLRRNLESYYPERFYARRSNAWQAIGAIPSDVGLLQAYDAYQQGQVLGFYDSQSEELVYTGDADLDRIEHFVLAHELTHAIDDQHFDLDRLDEMVARCEDEPFEAALGIVEGSANHFATQVFLRFPVTATGSPPSDGRAREVPPMIVEIFAYPYTVGQRFADALADEGGPAAIDRALETFPVSTEQVLHPSKYPEDVPQTVDVPDFAPTFGPGWRDLDVMVVGEVWVKALLNLRLDEPAAAEAAAGWDGGIYRAWSDGDEVAVILSTVWDTPEDARAFSEALRRWVSRGTGPGLVLEADGTQVHAGFGSSDTLMDAVTSAVWSL